MPFITSDDGAQIFYKDWGTTGTPVILSHGWPLNADAWEAAALFLAEHGHRAIAHDRRGHGRSSQTWHGNEMDTYADDLATLIDTLDLRDVTLVGHSTGGGEIVRYIGRHGTARVAKLVLVSAVPPLMLHTDDNPEGLPVEVFDADPGRRSRRPVPALPRSGRRTLLRPQPQQRHLPRCPRRVLAAEHGLRAPRRVRVHRRLLGHRLPTRPRQGRRADAGHPRRRRPDRPVRGRREALGGAGRRRGAEGLRRTAPTAYPTPTETACTPTCSTSSTPDRKEHR